MAGRAFALEYLHDPGGARDGVTMTVPLIALNQVSAARAEWVVPGLLKEKVQLLAKSLPQKVASPLGTDRRVRIRVRRGGCAVRTRRSPTRSRATRAWK